MTNPADIPPPLPWEQRSTRATSIPGGYTRQLHTLHEVCLFVSQERPKRPALVRWIQDKFGISEGSSEDMVRSMVKIRILETTGSQITLNQHANQWFESGEDGIIVALLHSQVRFFGEMLAELREAPLTVGELHEAAEKYDLNWETQSQIEKRRGWLESAKLIEPTDRGCLAITDAGRDLLERLDIYKPSEKAAIMQSISTPDPSDTGPEVDDPLSLATDAPKPGIPAAAPDHSPAEGLAREIRDASTDSKNPDRLEIAVRDAFQLLGFDAEKLGGSGKTDVLVKAPLGRDDSYSVTIDAKTVGAGSLGDGQVDWVTLDDHRKQHSANYSMLVGPNPSGKRLMDRAVAKTVAVLSTDQLAELCLQHADAPLGLQSYRALFETGGAVDTSPIKNEVQNLTRLRDLAAEICGNLAERTKAVGPIRASQLLMVLGHSTSESEIQQVLDTLASPLFGAIQGTADKGYILATAPRVIQQRLQQLGSQLAR